MMDNHNQLIHKNISSDHLAVLTYLEYVMLDRLVKKTMGDLNEAYNQYYPQIHKIINELKDGYTDVEFAEVRTKLDDLINSIKS